MKDVVAIGDRLVAVGRDGTNAAVWTSPWRQRLDARRRLRTDGSDELAADERCHEAWDPPSRRRSRAAQQAGAFRGRGVGLVRSRLDVEARPWRLRSPRPADARRRPGSAGAHRRGYDNAGGPLPPCGDRPSERRGRRFEAVPSRARTTSMNSIALLDYGTLLGVGDEGETRRSGSHKRRASGVRCQAPVRSPTWSARERRTGLRA